MVGGSQGAQVKLSDGSVKTVTAAAAGHLSKPGTTTLRMTGGVITAASSTPGSVSAAAAASQQQASFTALMFFCFILPDSWFEITFKKGHTALTLKWILSIYFMLASWYFYFQVLHLGFHQIQFEIKFILPMTSNCFQCVFL